MSINSRSDEGEQHDYEMSNDSRSDEGEQHDYEMSSDSGSDEGEQHDYEMSSDSGSDEGEQHDYEIHQIDTGATEATSIPVNKLKKGGYVLLEGRPCRVVKIAKSKTGKHGHAKANIAGTDIFTGRQYEAHLPTSHDIEVPFVERQDYQLINIDGKNTQLLDLKGNMREDVEMADDDVSNRLRSEFDEQTGEDLIVTVLSSNGESKIIEFKKSQ
jgi:translation initiation factor 5A